MVDFKDIREVEEAIEMLSQLNGLKACPESCPFGLPADEMAELQNKITAILKNYTVFLTELNAGNISICDGQTSMQLSPTSEKQSKNAIAYKADIDTDLICSLWEQGVSLNKIAKRVGCSPHTVKSRLSEMQHSIKE